MSSPIKRQRAKSTVLVLGSLLLMFLAPYVWTEEPPTPAIIDFRLFLDNDTLGVMCDGQQNSFALSSFPTDTDTTLIPDKLDLLLFSRRDTVTVHPTDHPVTILITSPLDTVFEIVIFVRDKLEILCDFPQYDDSLREDLPIFTYSTCDDSNLVKLRQTFNLDSVAGPGREIQRLLNLLKWAHQIVRHDGNSTNPTPANALNLIAVCRSENRGVNCRMMATILNEAFLAAGFKSRHVTCFPLDRNDTDCHVITMVWSNTLKKWLYLDPTFYAYFMDKDSTLLSPAEIRGKLIAGDILLLNDDLNWNGQPYNKNQYLRYMAKNLFRFSCPVGSEFGYESKKEGRDWVYLDPVGFNSADLQDSTRIPVKHETHNAAYFWGAP